MPHGMEHGPSGHGSSAGELHLSGVVAKFAGTSILNLVYMNR
eukprot:SAG31_NODE_11444_length_1029_cov_3.978495_1_plen_41_part_10